jgi:hypothetical protein
VNKPFYNMHRAIQATCLLPFLQQASLKDSEPIGKKDSRDHRVLNAHRVLEVLGRMMASPPDPKSKPKRNPKTITDTCFPNLVSLCRDTCLKDSTLREALGHLTEWGIITKTHDPGYVPHKGKHGPVYDHCRYWLVPEVWNQAWSPLGDKYEARISGVDPTPAPSKATSPKILAADAEVLDSFYAVAPDAEPPVQRTKEEQEIVQSIHELLRDHLGEHRTYAQPDAEQMMAKCVDDCIELAEDPQKCLDVMTWVVGDDKLRDPGYGFEKTRRLSALMFQGLAGEGRRDR